ncbi:MAG: sodium:proton antiporter NhaD [Bacteroidota bacterium]|nr:sodium:proton antiporter NhaD [Bacteroidota bacterium]
MLVLISIFIVTYILIIAEHYIKVNKSAVTLISAGLCWTVLAFNPSWIISGKPVEEALLENMPDTFGILLFLLGALTIVEIIDLHHGFDIVVRLIKTKKVIMFMIIISALTFFLSSILDNITTAVVMISITRKVIRKQEIRLYIAGIIIIAANSGGVFSPIGDVTTTMLWMANRISTFNIITTLFLPALVSYLVPLVCVIFMMKRKKFDTYSLNNQILEVIPGSQIIFFCGLSIMILIPVFKTVTGLPPYLGMMFGMGILWLVAELIHLKSSDEHEKFSAADALSRLDTPSILFFFGILVTVAALDQARILEILAERLNQLVGNLDIVALGLGLSSAVIDNVPLIAGTISMYDLDKYPTDNRLWELLAYSCGIGGSILVIGSAAGVAVMGIEKINFVWYLKRFSLPALLGYGAGAGIFFLLN